MTQSIAPAVKPQTFARGKRGNFENRLDEVLRAAARLFSQEGFRRATLEDVATALHITRPALYHYARSKDELAAKCLAIAISEIDDAIESARRHESGREQLKAFFHRYAEIVCDDFGRCFVLVNRRERSLELQQVGRTHERRFDNAVREMVRAGVEDGSLRDVDPADVSRALFAAFNGIPVWFRAGGHRSSSQIGDDFLSLLLAGLTS